MNSIHSNQPRQTAHVVLATKRVCQFLLGAIVILAVAGIAGQVARYSLGIERAGGLIPVFDLDREYNIPAWFSSALLLLNGLLLTGIAAAVHLQEKSFLRHWQVLAALFFFLSLDEAIRLHEQLMAPLAALELTGVFHYSWVIPGFIFVALVGLTYLRFVICLDEEIRRLFILAATLYLGGALGTEMVRGWYASNFGVMSLAYPLITALEESLEMLGLGVFVRALLTQLSRFQVQYSVSR